MVRRPEGDRRGNFRIGRFAYAGRSSTGRTHHNEIAADLARCENSTGCFENPLTRAARSLYDGKRQLNI